MQRRTVQGGGGLKNNNKTGFIAENRVYSCSWLEWKKKGRHKKRRDMLKKLFGKEKEWRKTERTVMNANGKNSA